MRITLLAVGTLKNAPLKDAFAEYRRRLSNWQLDVVEVPTGTKETENAELLAKIEKLGGDVIALDERGENLNTRALADRFQTRMNEGVSRTVIVIGGADGLSDAIRQRARFCLSFGALTWPHQMVRVMLAEQMYRCQQILSGHPYHRD